MPDLGDRIDSRLEVNLRWNSYKSTGLQSNHDILLVHGTIMTSTGANVNEAENTLAEWVRSFLFIGGIVGLVFLYRYVNNRYFDGERRAAERKAEAENAVALQVERDAKIICPHCQVTGRVTTQDTTSKRGISGGKATGAFLTGGWSLLVTGLSRAQSVRAAQCANCGMKWVVDSD